MKASRWYVYEALHHSFPAHETIGVGASTIIPVYVGVM